MARLGRATPFPPIIKTQPVINAVSIGASVTAMGKAAAAPTGRTTSSATMAGMAKSTVETTGGTIFLFGLVKAMLASASFPGTSGQLPRMHIKAMAAARASVTGTAFPVARIRNMAKARAGLRPAALLRSRVKAMATGRGVVFRAAKMAARVGAALKARAIEPGRIAFLRGRVAGQLKALPNLPRFSVVNLAGLIKGVAKARVQLRSLLHARITGLLKARDAFLTTNPFSDPEVFYGRAERGMFTGRDECDDCCQDDDGWDF